MSLIEADAMTRDARLGSDHRPRRGLRAHPRRPRREPERDRSISAALSTMYDPIDVDAFLEMTNNATLDEILSLPREETSLGARREVEDN